jgi:hypothetical protein
MRFEVLLAEAPHFFEAGGVRPARVRTRHPGELRLQKDPQRTEPVRPDRWIDAVVRVASLALLAHEPALLQEPQVAGDTRLRDAQDPGQLGHIEPFERQQPQEPQPRLVAEQPVQGRRVIHIYKSTLVDVWLTRPNGESFAPKT